MKRLKNKAVPSKNTTRKKNNGGMTYIELLVALSLLVLVVTVFSPMLLRSYDSLYKAGEMTDFAYDARTKIEEGLSIRENNDTYDIKTNFEKLSNSVNIKARQIISSVNGLETLYGGARGRLKVVSDNIVSDNQDAQVVRLLVTNLDKDKYTFKAAPSATAAQNPAVGEVLFYVCSVFDDTVQLKYTVNDVAGTNYLDVFITNLDVTKAPIKFIAYFQDDFGVIKTAETYLYIEPADMMFVGDSGSVDYFTSAGIDAEKGTFYIAGRQMTTAPIGGEKLNDVEWVGTENDSSILDGYYLMCGENSVVRRLWRTRDSSKSANITYKTTAINGNAYFQYDWKGDYMDVTALSDDDGVDIINYGSNSDSNADFGDGNYMTKNQYRTDSAYFSYYVNGYTSAGNTYANNNKRISYALEESKETMASVYNVAPESGVYIIKGKRVVECNRGETAIGNEARDRAHVYCAHCNTWFSYGTRLDWFTTVVNEPRAIGYYGLNYKTSFFMNSSGHGNAQISSGAFSVRHCVPEGNGWASSESATTDSIDENLSCVILKAYNTVSPSGLAATSTVNATSHTSEAKPNLKSCIALPGNSGDALYVGSLDSSALINTTKGVVGGNYTTSDGSEYTVDQGYGVSYVYIGDGEKTYKKVYDQTKTFDITSTLNNGGKLPVKPNAGYGYNTFKTEYASNTYLNGAETISDLRFTMGYSSDMYKVFSALNDADKKPFEQYYSASTGITDTGTNSTFRQNLWFPREFFNVTESDAYNKSVVACGYDVGGYSEMYYVHLPDWTTTTNTRFLYGTHDMDWDNNGVIDYFDPASDKYGTLVAGTTLVSGGSSAFLYPSFNDGDHRFYFLDAQPGASEGDGTKTVLALPRHVSLSTQLNKVTNNGVLSVYNESERAFTPIYYYKDPNKQSVRFNCVSTFGITDSIVGAAVGLSDGKVMLAQIPYNDGKLSTAALTEASCPKTNAIEHITSITAVKGFNYDLYGDDNMEMLIVAGGVKAAGKALALRICDVTDLSKYNEYAIQLEASGTNVTEITDVAAVNGYLYISAKTSDNKGVIYSFNMRELKNVVGKGLVEKGKTELVTGLNIKKTTSYYTEFSVDIDDGVVIGSGSSKDLPVINSIAAKAEQ